MAHGRRSPYRGSHAQGCLTGSIVSVHVVRAQGWKAWSAANPSGKNPKAASNRTGNFDTAEEQIDPGASEQHSARRIIGCRTRQGWAFLDAAHLASWSGVGVTLLLHIPDLASRTLIFALCQPGQTERRCNATPLEIWNFDDYLVSFSSRV